MYFELTQDQQRLRKNLRRAMAKILTPEYMRRIDQNGLYPYDAYHAWVEMGLLGRGIPEQFGGSGGSIEDLVFVSEELGHWSYDVSAAYIAPLFAALTLLECGREEQKAEFLPKLADGRTRMSACFSEPLSGSDPCAINTRATRIGNEWLLNGQKLWTTAAGAKKNLLQIYARTDPDAPPSEGLSVFLVENNAPGIECRKLDVLGRSATGSYQVFMKDVSVDERRVMGGVNRGWDYLLAGLPVEWILTSAGYVGASQKVVDLATHYAKANRQLGRAVGEFQATSHMLVDMQTEVDAARLLVYRAADRLSRRLDALREASMAKLFGSETYAKVSNQGMQIMGACGYSLADEMQRHFRDARSTTIGSGSLQIQRNTIASTMELGGT